MIGDGLSVDNRMVVEEGEEKGYGLDTGGTGCARYMSYAQGVLKFRGCVCESFCCVVVEEMHRWYRVRV